MPWGGRLEVRVNGIVAALLTGIALTLSVLIAAAPANAETTGTVKARTQRTSAPNLDSQTGWWEVGTPVDLQCSTQGQAVKGFFSFNIPDGGWDNLWYRTPSGDYIADADIETGTLKSVTPTCSDFDAQRQQPQPQSQPDTQPQPQSAPQPQSEPQSQVLGPVDGGDVAAWCNASHGTNIIYSAGPMNLSDPYSWHCTLPPYFIPGDGVDMNAACTLKYGSPAYSFVGDAHQAHSWMCRR
jgi:hypothetical protein